MTISLGNRRMTKEASDSMRSNNGGDYDEWEEPIIANGTEVGVLHHSSYEEGVCAITGAYGDLIFMQIESIGEYPVLKELVREWDTYRERTVYPNRITLKNFVYFQSSKHLEEISPKQLEESSPKSLKTTETGDSSNPNVKNVKKTFYKAVSFKTEIQEVEVEKYTDRQVWIDGRRHKRVTSYISFFKTEQEARQHLISIRERRIEHLAEEIARMGHLKEELERMGKEIQQLELN